jgi:hypothetical protein
MDFDFIESHNLDRLSYATRADVARLKVEVQAAHLAARGTADPFRVETVPAAVFEEEGFRAALDCDVLFSCVDRLWSVPDANMGTFAPFPALLAFIVFRCACVVRMTAFAPLTMTSIEGQRHIGDYATLAMEAHGEIAELISY